MREKERWTQKCPSFFVHKRVGNRYVGYVVWSVGINHDRYKAEQNKR